MHGVQHVTDDECPIGANHPLRRLYRPGLPRDRGRRVQTLHCMLHPPGSPLRTGRRDNIMNRPHTAPPERSKVPLLERH